MIDIEVARYAGDAQGADIVDALIGSVPCAISRGRAELDANAQSITNVTVDVAPSGGYRSGDLVRVLDAAQGPAWIGKTKSVRLQFQAPASRRCFLEVERHATD